jgi:leucyl-tRNA synthetase
LLTQGMVIKDGAKMSKSKGNVVDPDFILTKYGADTARLFSLFAAPPERDLDWSDQGVDGAYRFLHRVWTIMYKHSEAVKNIKPAGPEARGDKLFRKTHLTIKKVTEDIEREFHFNTAISALMEMVNEMYDYTSNGFSPDKQGPVLRSAMDALMLLITPFAPHFAEELWESLGHRESIANAPWPTHDPEAIVSSELTVVVQVNGKVRSKLTLPAGASERDIEAAALADPKVKEFTNGKTPRKVIVVQGKLVNVVV